MTTLNRALLSAKHSLLYVYFHIYDDTHTLTHTIALNLIFNSKFFSTDTDKIIPIPTNKTQLDLGLNGGTLKFVQKRST